MPTRRPRLPLRPPDQEGSWEEARRAGLAGTAGSGARVTSLGLPSDLEPAAVPRHGPLPVQRGRVLLFQHSRRRQAVQVRSPPRSRAWPPFPGETVGRGRRSVGRAEVRKHPEPVGGSPGGLWKPPGVPTAAGRVPEGSALRRCLNPAPGPRRGSYPALPPPARSGRGRPSTGRSFLLAPGAGLLQGTSGPAPLSRGGSEPGGAS